MAGFIVPFRNTLFQELKLQFDKEDRIEIFSIIVDSTKMDLIDCVQAKEIIESTFSLYDANFVQNRSETEDLRIPKPFRKYIRSLVSR